MNVHSSVRENDVRDVTQDPVFNFHANTRGSLQVSNEIASNAKNWRSKKIVSSMSASYTFLGLMKAVLGASPTTSLVFVFSLFLTFFLFFLGC